MIRALILSTLVSACASPPAFSEKTVFVALDLREKSEGSHFGGRTRIRTNVTLVPNKKTLLGGVTATKDGKPLPQEFYYIRAQPMGESIHFTVYKNQAVVGEMLLAQKAGEKAILEGINNETRIEILSRRSRSGHSRTRHSKSSH